LLNEFVLGLYAIHGSFFYWFMHLYVIWLGIPDGLFFKMSAGFCRRYSSTLSAGGISWSNVLGKRKLKTNPMLYCMLGTGLLWFGWFGFNAVLH
jgi:ammonia channel protein AmtB